MKPQQTLADTIKEARQCIHSLTGLELTIIEGAYLRQHCEESLRLAQVSSAEYDIIHNLAFEGAHRFLRVHYGLYEEDIWFIEILLDGDQEGFTRYFRQIQEKMHHP